MAKSVKIKVDEYRALKVWMAADRDPTKLTLKQEEKAVAALEAVLKRYEEPVKLKQRTGFPALTFVQMAREALGDRLLLPPKPSNDWFRALGHRLKMQGLEMEHVTKMLETAKRWQWKTVTPEKLLFNAAQLLAEDSEQQRARLGNLNPGITREVDIDGALPGEGEGGDIPPGLDWEPQ